MGCWGMGITQSDEFLEVYDKFMEEYDDGKPCTEITADILSKYHAEFSDDDGVMHDVYFALAKAEWMCCEQSELVLKRVREIIESDANVEFYRELEAVESDLKIRRKNLNNFLKSLLTPREKPRKRKRSAPMPKKVFPPMELGDCFSYKFDRGYRVFCVLEIFNTQKGNERATVAILNREFDTSDLTSWDFLAEDIGALLTVSPEDFLGASVIKKVGSIEIKNRKREHLLGNYVILPGDKKSFRSQFLRPMRISLGELLYHCEENSPEILEAIEIGGCFAYMFRGEYRFAAILDNPQIQGNTCFLVAIFNAFSGAPKADFLSLPIASLNTYEAEELPNMSDWQKVGYVDVPKNAHKRLFRNTRYLGQGILDFLREGPALTNKISSTNNLQQLLSYCKKNAPDAVLRLNVGDCYSFSFLGGYRFAVILDRFALYGEEQALVAVLSERHEDPMGHYMNDTISHFGIYSADTLPNMDSWVKRGEVTLTEDVKAYSSRYRAVTTECVMKFLASPAYSSGVLTLERFLAMTIPKR